MLRERASHRSTGDAPIGADQSTLLAQAGKARSIDREQCSNGDQSQREASHAACREGKSSTSRVRVLERRTAVSLVEVTIATGRPHQIRIHLAAAGHPLVGDPLYGAGGVPREGTQMLPGDLGYLLHAERLGFLHPVTGAPLGIEAPPPLALRDSRGH